MLMSAIDKSETGPVYLFRGQNGNGSFPFRAAKGRFGMARGFSVHPDRYQEIPDALTEQAHQSVRRPDRSSSSHCLYRAVTLCLPERRELAIGAARTSSRMPAPVEGGEVWDLVPGS